MSAGAHRAEERKILMLPHGNAVWRDRGTLASGAALLAVAKASIPRSIWYVRWTRIR
jgi:hypothetical protein